jgi:hypothetical protein
MISPVGSNSEMLAQMRPASAQLPPFPNLASNISRTGRTQGLKRNLAGPPAREILKCRNVITNEAIGIDSTLEEIAYSDGVCGQLSSNRPTPLQPSVEAARNNAVEQDEELQC